MSEQVTLQAIADHKAAFVGMNTMYLDGGTRTHFMGFLQEHHPSIVRRYDRLYAKKYVSKNYSALVKRRFNELRKQHHLPARGEPAPSPLARPGA